MVDYLCPELHAFGSPSRYWHPVIFCRWAYSYPVTAGVLRCYRLHPTLTFLISPRSNVLLRIVAARSAGYSQ